MKVLIVGADGTEYGLLGGPETDALYAGAARAYCGLADDDEPDVIRYNRHADVVAVTWHYADGDTTAMFPYREVIALMAGTGPCPAGGAHTWAVQEEAGTGRTGWACDECHAAPPTYTRRHA